MKANSSWMEQESLIRINVNREERYYPVHSTRKVENPTIKSRASISVEQKILLNFSKTFETLNWDTTRYIHVVPSKTTCCLFVNCFTLILYYTILYYTILYYNILYYTILYYTILYYTILYYTILYYTILYYTIQYYTIL